MQKKGNSKQRLVSVLPKPQEGFIMYELQVSSRCLLQLKMHAKGRLNNVDKNAIRRERQKKPISQGA